MAPKTVSTAYGRAVRAIPFIAWAMAVGTALFTVVGVFQAWQDGPTHIPVLSLPFLPEGSPAGLTGGFTEGMVRSAEVPTVSRVWWTAFIVVSGAMFVAVAVTVARIVSHVADGVGFTRSLARNLGILSVLVLVLGFASQVCLYFAGQTATLAFFGAEITGSAPAADRSFQPDFWPLWAALAIGALAFAFDRAARLQRDTAGLV